MKVSFPKITALTMFAVVLLFTSWHAAAQSPPPKTATTWQDLGFNQLPEGFSTDVIPLFEGLNEARGTWSFEGETADGEASDTPERQPAHHGQSQERHASDLAEWPGAGPLMIRGTRSFTHHGRAPRERV